jgi:hypothetical protein
MYFKTSHNYFFDAHPGLLTRLTRLKATARRLSSHHQALIKRIGSSYSEALYNRTFEIENTRYKIRQELDRIEFKYNEYCRDVLCVC